MYLCGEKGRLSTGAEIVVNRWRQEGADTIFGHLGGSIKDMLLA